MYLLLEPEPPPHHEGPESPLKHPTCSPDPGTVRSLPLSGHQLLVRVNSVAMLPEGPNVPSSALRLPRVRILYSRTPAVYLTFEAFLDKQTTLVLQALHDYLRSPSLPNLVPFPFPKTRKIGTIRTSYRLRNLAIHRGYPILSSSHQDLRASSEFRSSRTLVQDLEHRPRAPVPAIKITSRSGPIVPTTATPRARLTHLFVFEPPMLPLFLCAHLFDFKYMPPPLPMLFLVSPLCVSAHRRTYAPPLA